MENSFLDKHNNKLQKITSNNSLSNYQNDEDQKFKYEKLLIKVREIIEKNNNIEKKWFGFKINNDLAKLFWLCNISPDILNITENDNMSKKEKKKILITLIYLCQKTHSRQIYYYLNKWAKNETKCKGYDEFIRTFGQWFDFKNKPEKYNHIFTSSCSLLMSTLNLKHILMRNANKLYDFPVFYDNNNRKKINETEEERKKFIMLENERLKNLMFIKEQKKINEKIENEKKRRRK